MNTYEIPHFGLVRQYDNLREELLDATDNVLSTGQLLDGPYTAAFEKWLANKTGCEYAITVHSGTQALEFIANYHADISFVASNELIPKVRLPNLTYPATMNAFLTAGWDIELVDTDHNGIMKEQDEGIFLYNEYNCVVGLYGAPIKDVYSSVIVDGAQHWLVATKDDVGEGMAISFDPTKNLPSSGNGGAIVTNDIGLYERIKSEKNNGKPDYFHSGTNSKMSELDCSHLLVRTKHLDMWQVRRMRIRKYYLKEFEDMPFRCLSRGFATHADQKFVIYVDSKRDALHAFLTENGVESRIHYPFALSELPISRDITIKPDPISTSVALTRGVLSLPIYPELTDAEVEYIVHKVKYFYEQYK